MIKIVIGVAIAISASMLSMTCQAGDDMVPANAHVYIARAQIYAPIGVNFTCSAWLKHNLDRQTLEAWVLGFASASTRYRPFHHRGIDAEGIIQHVTKQCDSDPRQSIATIVDIWTQTEFRRVAPKDNAE